MKYKFISKNDIEDYFNNDYNDSFNSDFCFNIYRELTEIEDYKGLFDPLEFLNLFQEHYEFILSESNKPLTVKSIILNLKLNKKQLHYFLERLIMLIQFDDDLNFCTKILNAELLKLDYELNPQESIMSDKHSTIKNANKKSQKKTFPGFLVHSKKEALADKLKAEFKDEKGIPIRLMIEALHSYESPLIDKSNRSKLCEAIKAYFNGDTGTRQGVFPSGFNLSLYNDDLKSTKAKIDLILQSLQE